MAEDNGTQRGKDKPARLSRGFVRAGGLIEPQMRTAAARRGFAQARLRALWPEIAGPEFAAICAPLRLARARGPAGGLLTVAVGGRARAAAADAAAAPARAGERGARPGHGRAHPAHPGRPRASPSRRRPSRRPPAAGRRPTSGAMRRHALKHW